MEQSLQHKGHSPVHDISHKERFFLALLDDDLVPVERLPSGNRCVLRCDYLGVPTVFTYPAAPAELELFDGRIPGTPRLLKRYETLCGMPAHLRVYYPATLQDAQVGRGGWRLGEDVLQKDGVALIATDELYARLAATMGMMHERGYAGLDITPRNVFLTERGEPVLGELFPAVRAEASLDARLKELDRQDFESLFSVPRPISRSALHLAEYLRKN